MTIKWTNINYTPIDVNKQYWQMLTRIVDKSEDGFSIPQIVEWVHTTYNMPRDKQLVKLITDTLYEAYCDDFDDYLM